MRQYILLPLEAVKSVSVPPTSLMFASVQEDEMLPSRAAGPRVPQTPGA